MKTDTYNPRNLKFTSRLLNPDIYRYIASNSSLTLKQVEECFKTYHKLLLELSTSKYVSEDLRISLPLVGMFFFAKRKGRKAGTVYDMPIASINEVRHIELTEDEPDVYLLKFKPSVILARKIKKYFKKGVDDAATE